MVAMDRTPGHRRPTRREWCLGFDTKGRLLETVLLIFPSEEGLVIHALPARRKYLDLLP